MQMRGFSVVTVRSDDWNYVVVKIDDRLQTQTYFDISISKREEEGVFRV